MGEYAGQKPSEGFNQAIFVYVSAMKEQASRRRRGFIAFFLFWRRRVDETDRT
jgi:hypothetical protein